MLPSFFVDRHQVGSPAPDAATSAPSPTPGRTQIAPMACVRTAAASSRACIRAPDNVVVRSQAHGIAGGPGLPWPASHGRLTSTPTARASSLSLSHGMPPPPRASSIQSRPCRRARNRPSFRPYRGPRARGLASCQPCGRCFQCRAAWRSVVRLRPGGSRSRPHRACACERVAYAD